MKQISAILKPHVVPRVIDAIRKLPSVPVCKIIEVKGFGRQKSYLHAYLGSEYSMAYVPKIMVQMEVTDEQTENIIAVIIEATRSGRMGDGKIFVLPANEESSLLVGIENSHSQKCCQEL
ncbi:MAG: P-II family nitrogen regulator [Thermoguttaceae bacterium]